MKTGFGQGLAWWTGTVVVVLAVGYVVPLVISGVKLKNAYADLQKDGRPMTAAEIIPKPVADKDNAAFLYNSAASLLKSTGDAVRDVDPSKLSGDGREACVSFLGREDVIKVLALIEEAVAKPQCRFDLDYSQGPGIPLAHLAQLRQMARIIAVKARLEMERKDYDGAFKSVILGYKVANALQAEPFLISQLVRIAKFSIIDPVTQDLCGTVPPTEEQAATLISLIKPFADNDPMVMAIDSERLLLGEWIFNLAAPEREKIARTLETDFTGPIHLLLMFKPYHQFMHASYLRTMNEMAKYMAAPYWEMNVDVGRKITDNLPRWDVFSRMLVPAVVNVKAKQAILMARARVLQTGLSLIRYKLANGKFPVTLAECDAKFLPAQPVDPFSGKPLVYKQEGAGFILYSIGENMKDDGGKPEPCDATPGVKEKKEWDLVWKFDAK